MGRSFRLDDFRSNSLGLSRFRLDFRLSSFRLSSFRLSCGNGSHFETGGWSRSGFGSGFRGSFRVGRVGLSGFRRNRFTGNFRNRRFSGNFSRSHFTLF